MTSLQISSNLAEEERNTQVATCPGNSCGTFLRRICKSVVRFVDENIIRPLLIRFRNSVAPYQRGSVLNNGTRPERVTGAGISNSIEENCNFPNPVGDEEEGEGEGGEEEAEAEAEGEEEEEEENAPSRAPYALTTVLTSSWAVLLVLKQGKHTSLRVAKPLVLFSLINDHSGYKKLKAIYYMACNLAFISVLWISGCLIPLPATHNTFGGTWRRVLCLHV